MRGEGGGGDVHDVESSSRLNDEGSVVARENHRIRRVRNLRSLEISIQYLRYDPLSESGDSDGSVRLVLHAPGGSFVQSDVRGGVDVGRGFEVVLSEGGEGSLYHYESAVYSLLISRSRNENRTRRKVRRHGT